MQNQILNLCDFTALVLTDCFTDAQVSLVEAADQNMKVFRNGSAYFNFYSIIYIETGQVSFCVNGTILVLEPGNLLFVAPYQLIQFPEEMKGVYMKMVLIESVYYHTVRSVDDEMPKTIVNTFLKLTLTTLRQQEFITWYHQLRHAMVKRHLYQASMMKNLIHFGQLFLSELTMGEHQRPHDSGHKENIFRIFIHLAFQYYKVEHQVQFYADRMNITPVYLTRTVKEVSGNTVLAYLQSMLYNEACVQLSSTSKSIGEISEELRFNDQSAFSNFFKLHSGMSPVAYRGNKRDEEG